MKYETAAGDPEPSLPSLRSFGLTFAVVFALIGLFPIPFGGSPRVWALSVAAGVLAVTFTVPSLFSPFNRLWFRFGMLLHKIMNPLVMGIIYFGMLVPMALGMRAFGKRFLLLAREPQAPSYWISREPAGPDPSTINQQF